MRLIIFFVAIALAVGAFFATLHFTQKKPEPVALVQEPKVIEKEQPKSKIFVARQDIPIGTAVTRTMLDIAEYQQNLLLPDMAVVEDAGSSPIDGMISRSPIVKGEIILKRQFANPNDPSFLAAALTGGMRLVTVGLDAVSGGGGFIYPGDHVDVLVTHDTAAGLGTPKNPTTEVMIPNVRVLAVNQKSATTAGEGPTLPSNISLEVSQLDAERLRLAENGNGKISLVLRSLKDEDNAFIARPAVLSDLSRQVTEAVKSDGNKPDASPSVQQPPLQQGGTLDVIRGVKKESIQIPILF